MNQDNSDKPKLPRIILVDDEKITLFLTQRILLNHNEDFIIESYISGKEAIQNLASQEHLDNTVILLDINMPLYNGWDFLNDFSNALITCPVFMFTSSIDKNDMQISESYDVVKGFISKPLTSEKIEKILAEM
jgi:CheY-like chemotaxis protein